MNPDLDKLQPYPFEKLAALKSGCTPPGELEHIALSLGEPQHDAPEIVLASIQDNLKLNNRYPLTKGTLELREAICTWLQRRFKLTDKIIDAEHNIIPVNGTREALFAFAQCVIDQADDAIVMIPNPFYQIYEGAALLAGATPWFYNTDKTNNYLPDFDTVHESIWRRCQLLYICTPGNPTGRVFSEEQLADLIEKSLKYDFIIASDECYSEIYFDNDQPPGLLQVAAERFNNLKNCIVFHSLSKRSNLAGMRSGFVAGDADIIKSFLRYRTYHGCAMPLAHQAASITAWNDEDHVQSNRKMYKEKFDAVLDILKPVCNAQKPDAGFYIWLNTPISDTDFAQQLFSEQNVTVLPGSYLSREANNTNPGSNHVRMALVAPLDECIEAANRIKQFIESLN